MQEHSELIDALGGTTAVAKLTGQGPTTVSNWRERGIPWRWRPFIKESAEQVGVVVPKDFFERAERIVRTAQ